MKNKIYLASYYMVAFILLIMSFFFLANIYSEFDYTFIKRMNGEWGFYDGKIWYYESATSFFTYIGLQTILAILCIYLGFKNINYNKVKTLISLSIPTLYLLYLIS